MKIELYLKRKRTSTLRVLNSIELSQIAVDRSKERECFEAVKKHFVSFHLVASYWICFKGNNFFLFYFGHFLLSRGVIQPPPYSNWVYTRALNVVWRSKRPFFFALAACPVSFPNFQGAFILMESMGTLTLSKACDGHRLSGPLFIFHALFYTSLFARLLFRSSFGEQSALELVLINISVLLSQKRKKVILLTLLKKNCRQWNKIKVMHHGDSINGCRTQFHKSISHKSRN